MKQLPAFAEDPFDRPVPGQSLTVPPKSMPYERPPQFVDVDEAAGYVFDNISKKDNAIVMAGLLDRGAYASDIANTILLGGVAEGKWTPDVAMLMAKRVLASVVTVGHKVGVKDMKYKRPDTKMAQLKDSVFSLPRGYEEDTTSGPTNDIQMRKDDRGIEPLDEDTTSGPEPIRSERPFFKSYDGKSQSQAPDLAEDTTRGVESKEIKNKPKGAMGTR